MQIQNETITTLDNLKYLPGYARFLLDEKLDALAEVQLRIIREIKLPMLQYFRDFSEEQLLGYSKKPMPKYWATWPATRHTVRSKTN